MCCRIKFIYHLLRALLAVSWIVSTTSVSYFLATNEPRRDDTQSIVAYVAVFVSQLGLTIASILYPVVARKQEQEQLVVLSQFAARIDDHEALLSKDDLEADNLSTGTHYNIRY